MPRRFLYLLFFLMIAASPVLSAAEENPTALAGLRFDGIAYDKQEPQNSIVMINAIALHLGDIYRGFKVAEIAEDHIVLTDAQTNEAYELSPGDGQANVQKRGTWKIPAAPAPASVKEAQKWVGDKTKGFTDAVKETKEILTSNPLQKSYDRTKAQIDQIKADRDKRDAELNKLFDNPTS